MKLELIVIIVLVFFLVLVGFLMVTQRKALKVCFDDKEDLNKRLQEATFQARELERTQETEGDELKSKVEEQTKQIEEMQANFEATMDRKNEHLTATSNQLKQASEEIQRLRSGVQSILAERDQLVAHLQGLQAQHSQTQGTTQGTTPQPTPQGTVQCDPATGSCTVQPQPLTEEAPVKSTESSQPLPQETQSQPVGTPPTFPSSLFSAPAQDTVVHIDGTGAPPSE